MSRENDMANRRTSSGGSRHKPPSRLRYENSHPVVSFRVKQEFYEEFVRFLHRSNKSIGDFFLEALGIQQSDDDTAYQLAYREGYLEAKKRYRVTYTCIFCRERLEVTSGEAKAAVAEQMKWTPFVHPGCRRRGTT